MPISIVVGGQLGSEGKGKVVQWLANRSKAKAVVRVGGPNSGHTIVDNGFPIKLQQVPASSLIEGVIGIIAPGSYINKTILMREIESLKLSPDNLIIDPNAFLLTHHGTDPLWEEENKLRENIGSTLSGTGAAVIRRASRSSDSSSYLASSDENLKPFVRNTNSILRSILNKKERVIIEGTQGFGLSVLHSPYYPFATARDTTAAGFLSEAGLSPIDVDEVIMVLRSYPIRVAGHSGPLPNEISWDELSSRINKQVVERTTVTNSIRRVAEFDPDLVRKAIMANNPTSIVMNHLDYIQEDFRAEFLSKVEEDILRPIDFVGLSPSSIVQRLSIK